MLQNFEVITPLFEGHIYERVQFKLNIEGNEHRGIFHNGEVQWFQPHPQHDIEENVRELVTNQLLQ